MALAVRAVPSEVRGIRFGRCAAPRVAGSAFPGSGSGSGGGEGGGGGAGAGRGLGAALGVAFGGGAGAGGKGSAVSVVGRRRLAARIAAASRASAWTGAAISRVTVLPTGRVATRRHWGREQPNGPGCAPAPRPRWRRARLRGLRRGEQQLGGVGGARSSHHGGCQPQPTHHGGLTHPAGEGSGAGYRPGNAAQAR